MKKTLAFLLVLMMVLSVLPLQVFAAGEGVTFEVGKVTAATTDEEVEVPITIMSSDGTLVSLDVGISWDPTVLTLKEIKFNSNVLKDNFSTDSESSYAASGKADVSVRTSNSHATSETGEYATIVFTVKEGIAVGEEYPITVTSVLALDERDDDISTSYTSGSVTVSDDSGNVTLKSIKVTTPPDKTSYKEGEIFESTGMVVTATYSDGSTKDVTNSVMITPDGALSKSDKTVTISYSEDGIGIVKTTFSITVESEDGGEIPTPSEEFPFRDVEPNNWFYSDVYYVWQENLVNGTSPTTYSPHMTTTRAMIVTLLYRMEGSPTVSGASQFKDIKAGSYYEKAIIWAAAKGIAKGFDEETFGPNIDITREQLAALMYRYSEYKGYDTSARAVLSKYTDAGDISGYAVDYLSWANANGLINGMTATTLEPRGNATRAQVAAILHRFCEKYK